MRRESMLDLDLKGDGVWGRWWHSTNKGAFFITFFGGVGIEGVLVCLALV
jgi:hypothetical protein